VINPTFPDNWTNIYPTNSWMRIDLLVYFGSQRSGFLHGLSFFPLEKLEI
jgi:hypothetical protein